MAVLTLLTGLAGAPARAVTDAEVDTAIDKAVEYLLGNAQPDGRFSPDGKYLWVQYSYPYGHEAVVMMALAHAGVSLEDERMRRGLEFLLNAPLEHTYTRSCRVITIARLLPMLDPEQRRGSFRVMKQDVQWLLERQRTGGGHDDGMWSYPTKPNRNADFSNTQFAILAMHEYEMAGGELPAEPYLLAQKAFLRKQRADGGWNYGWEDIPKLGPKPSYDSMTAIGVASLYIIRDKLYNHLSCPCRGGHSGNRPAEIDRAILRGIKWLGENYKARTGSGHNKYMHYACARVGLAAGLKYFGTHDWYREGAEYVVRTQDDDGSWASFKRQDRTCFALMFLIKGRAPVLLNKLQFHGKWDMHPRDAAHLARYVGHAKEQPMSWQVVGLETPVDEWHDAPLLYITAESAIDLSEEDKRKLREFTDTGGTILFEASCGNRNVGAWWQRACREIWPEWELKRLEKDHPLWEADLRLEGRRPRLMGMFDGTRTFVIYSPQDISCAWHTFAIIRQRLLFDLGCNLYAYATDRGKLRSKLAERRASEAGGGVSTTAVSPGPRTTLRVRLLEHGGDWYVSRRYRPLRTLAEYAADRGGLTLQVGDPAKPTDEAAAKTDVFWVTGRKGLAMSPDRQSALKDWLRAGGFLAADACMGDPAFDKAFRDFAGRLGVEVRPLGPESPLLKGDFGGPSGFNLTNVDFTRSLKPDRIGKPHAELCGLYLDDRLAGLYTPVDAALSLTGVKAFGNRGYETADARAVATNMLLPATVREAADGTEKNER